MNILLVDVDSVIPNLALMKVSNFYKKLGYSIELVKCGISYYPNKQKVFNLNINKKYYKIFISCVFMNTFKMLNITDNFNNDISYGGTGINFINLPDKIENGDPDYSIYPENDTSYGFITRGCIRNCYFCVVPKKEGNLHFVKHPKDIIKHEKVRFLDNNILAYKYHKDILQWLVDNKIKCRLNEGLDIRLINKENSILLSQLNYDGEYIFAFDNIRDKYIIKEQLNLLSWRKNWQIKMYVYVHPDMKLEDTVYRINYLKENKCLPYVMRDISCWESDNHNFYVDLASWCNQPGIFKKMNFNEFLEKRHTKQDRIKNSKELYNRIK